jgi:hypothetical protein
MPSLSSKLRPDKPLSQALQLKAPLSMILPAPPRSAEATRQASIVAYLNDFALMMILALGSCMERRSNIQGVPDGRERGKFGRRTPLVTGARQTLPMF